MGLSAAVIGRVSSLQNFGGQRNGALDALDQRDGGATLMPPSADHDAGFQFVGTPSGEDGASASIEQRIQLELLHGMDDGIEGRGMLTHEERVGRLKDAEQAVAILVPSVRRQRLSADIAGTTVEDDSRSNPGWMLASFQVGFQHAEMLREQVAADVNGRESAPSASAHAPTFDGEQRIARLSAHLPLRFSDADDAAGWGHHAMWVRG